MNTYGTCNICNMAYWEKNLIRVSELSTYIPFGESKSKSEKQFICTNCSHKMDLGEGVMSPRYEERLYPLSI